MVARIRAVLTLSLAITLGSASTPAPALSQNELIDLAIEAVNPNLKPARPVIVCVIGGTSVDACVKNYALAQGSQQVNEQLDDIDRIVRVYNLAKSGNMPGLVSTVGVTVACMTFGELPGAALVCNEYAAKLAAAGEYAVKATGEIVGPAGQAALNWIGQQASRFGCAIGFSCPRQKDPNTYVVNMGSHGSFAIAKFNLTAIWQQDYVPRVDEAIKSRIGDPAHYKAMLAEVNYGAPATWLSQDQLGWETINKLTGELSIEDRPIGIYPIAFAPFQHELNQRFAAIVNQRAADLVEASADRFGKTSESWMQLRLPIKAEALFDSAAPSISRSAALREAVNECRRNVEDPNFSLFRWALSGAAVGDNTQLDGAIPAQWAGKRQWCTTNFLPVLKLEIQDRRAHFDQALALGCARLPNGTKGLSCPGFTAGSPVASGSAMSHCVAAYKGSAKIYCQSNGSATVAPVRPQLRVPSAIRPSAPTNPPTTAPAPVPAPSPAPSPTPTFKPVLKPRVLIPGT